MLSNGSNLDIGIVISGCTRNDFSDFGVELWCPPGSTDERGTIASPISLPSRTVSEVHKMEEPYSQKTSSLSSP